MPLVLYPDERLCQRAQPRPVDDGLRTIGRRLLGAAKAANAYGLAAVHMGAVAPVVVISAASYPAERDYLVFYNPDVVSVAEETAAGPEGSVSMPGAEAQIVRPVWAEIAYDDDAGERQTRRFDGLPARIALHEIEQMNGVFFLDRLSRLKRDMVIKKWRKRAAD